MAVLDRLRPPVTVPVDVPGDVKARLDRGRSWMQRDAAKRRLCVKFEKGDTYWFQNSKGQLGFQSSALNPVGGQDRPPHRVRNTVNFIRPIVQGKVSRATQRIPGYEILPATPDPEIVDAALLAQKVALFGFEKWGLRGKAVKAAHLAIGGGGEAFAMPFFDTTIGPFLPVTDDDGNIVRFVGQGEVRVVILSGNEVSWEPGTEFDDSRWYMVERARPVGEVKDMPGFVGGDLSADANTADRPSDSVSDMVLVTEYLERPSTRRPNGRRIVIANNRVIVDARNLRPDADSPFEPYPLLTRFGTAVDMPVLHRLAWTTDCTDGRDLGLTWQLIDAQRTCQDCWNKLIEWKNRCLNPRMLAPRGSEMKPRVDVPGGIDWYKPVGDQIPQWETPPTGFAQPLLDMLGKMQQDMRELGFDSDIQAGANVAARTVNAVIEQDQAKWQSFMSEMADWHAQVMRHCLHLVSVYYTEPRKLAIRGRFGPETITNFEGANLLDQIDVRVLPGSLDYLTRDQVTQRVFAYADRQWISPQQAMAAVQTGTSDALVQSFELAQARVDRVIQRIREGTVMDMPTRPQPRTDPATGQTIVEDVPAWMPQDQVDDLDVWQRRLGDWMKTTDFEQMPADRQSIAMEIMAGIDNLRQAAAARQVQAQNAQAEQLGLANAAKPVQAKPLPDQASPTPSSGGGTGLGPLNKRTDQ